MNEERAKKSACGKDDCGVSTGIHGGLTFGFGELDVHGFWEIECKPCIERNQLREENKELRSTLSRTATQLHDSAQSGFHFYHARFQICPEHECQLNNEALGNKRLYKCDFLRCHKTVENIGARCNEHQDKWD